MPRAALTRVVTFDASHRFWSTELSDAKNIERFGAIASQKYHGHAYSCSVTVEGDIDAATGMVIDLGLLDHVLQTEVRARFDGKEINAGVAEFGDGGLVPTGENLARFIAGRVAAALTAAKSPALVTRVAVSENASLSAEYVPGR